MKGIRMSKKKNVSKQMKHTVGLAGIGRVDGESESQGEQDGAGGPRNSTASSSSSERITAP
jgi:hypothetical protein